MLCNTAESEVVERMILHKIPVRLSLLLADLNSYNIDSETCKLKIASILTNAKVKEMA